MNARTVRRAATAAVLAPLAAAAASTFTVRVLTPETALKAAQAALAHCRSEGYQVAVTVVDREGLTQVALRDRFAGAHTLEGSFRKAWTAASLKTDTSEVDKVTRPGEPLAGMRQLSRVVAVAGGVKIEAGGALLGAIGVSGAPGGNADEACARAGVKAITEDLEIE